MLGLKLVVPAFILLLILSGCTQDVGSPAALSNSDNSLPSSDLSANAICGNGIAEPGEIAENCCLDVACPQFFDCKELESGGQKVNTCAKQKLEETKQYKDIIKFLDAESAEYDKESALIDYDFILTKIEQMERAVSELEGSFDVNLEKTYVKYRRDRREWNVNRNALVEKTAVENDEEKFIELYQQIINLDKQELERLKGFSEEDIKQINSKFEYDILERQSYLEMDIPKEEKALELVKEGFQIELSIVDYNPTCYNNECFLDYVKIGIKNNGEAILQNPMFDFYIYEGDQVLSRDVDEQSYALSEIPVGYDGIYKATYIGYDNKTEISPGTYTLKVNLKSGVAIQAVASTSKTVTLR
ncbi:MAG: hypothetical protein V1494_06880 [Candidatus Diapherotrites archaeon]